MSFCNKDCNECTYKEALSCDGCLKGPGTWSRNDCEIAACARDKGHENCGTCEFSTSCGKLMEKDRMPQNRLDKIRRESENTERLSKKAAFLGKWMRRLFWLVIPMVLSIILGTNTVQNLSYTLYAVGVVLNIFCFLAYGILLLKMAPEEEKYKTAGICRIAVGAVGVLSIFITGNIAVTLMSIVSFIFSVTGEYNEYKGHAAALSGIDNELSEKWEKLWKWYIGMFIAIAVSLVIMLLMAILGLIILLVSLIGILVVSVIKLVYIYSSAESLNNYAALYAPKSIEMK